MSRYTLPLHIDTRIQLDWGYDRPLHKVFAHLVADNRGLYSFITTVGELMPAIADMLTNNNVRPLTDVEAAAMTEQLIADGTDPGTLT